ncbi:MAG: hypothetical protein ACI4U9_03880 [Clostridia bacterium]
MDSHVEELIEFKERCKSNTKRIDELEQEVKENRELTIAVREIATEMKHLREEQANMNDRLKIIEDKPSKNWEKIITTIIGTVVGALVGAVIGLILK